MKKNAIDPYRIHIETLNIIKEEIYNKISDPSANEIEGFQFNTEVNTQFNLEKKLNRTQFIIDIQAKNKEGKNVDAKASFIIEMYFKIDNLEDHILDKEGKPIFDLNLGVTLISICYSTIRGIIYARTLGTIFEFAKLPIVNPVDLIKKENRQSIQKT